MPGVNDLMSAFVALSFASMVFGSVRPVLFHREHGMVLRGLALGFLATTMLVVAGYALHAFDASAERKPRLSIADFAFAHANASTWLVLSLIGMLVECSVAAVAWVKRVPGRALPLVDAAYVNRSGEACPRARD